MNFLESMGDVIQKRPKLVIGIIVLITLLAGVSTAMSGLDMEMDTEDFMPQNDVNDANNEITYSFTTSDSFLGIVRSEDSVITKDAFLATVMFENATFNDDTVNKCLVDPDDHVNSIMSPADVVTMTMMGQLYGQAAAGDPNASMMIVQMGLDTSDPMSYDNMMRFLSSDMITDAMIQDTVFMMSQTPEGAMVTGLFTDDFESTANGTSANGMMVITNMDRDTFAFAPEEGSGLVAQIDLERAMTDAANDMNEEDVAKDAGVRVAVVGFAMLSDEIQTAAFDSIGELFPVAIALIVIVLLIVYRDVVDTIVGLAGLLIAILWTFGIASAIGMSFNPMTIAVPILILGLGIDYGLHVVLRYREERSEGNGVGESTRLTTVSVGGALLLATLTTVIAFMSNMLSSMPALQMFGIMCALGIVCSFVVMVLLIPAVQVIRDRRSQRKGVTPKRYRKRDDGQQKALGRIVGFSGRMASKAPAVVIVGTIVVVGVFGYGAFYVESSYDYYDFLPDDLQSTQDLMYLTDNFSSTGLASANVLVRGNATDPAIIAALDESVDNMAGTPNVLTANGSTMATYMSTVLLDWSQEPTNETNLLTYQMMYPAYFNATSGHILPTTTQDNVTALVGLLYMHGMAGDELVFLDLSGVMGTNEDGEAVTQVIVQIKDGLGNDEVLTLYDDLQSDLGPVKDLGVYAIPTGSTISGAITNYEMDQSQVQSLLLTILATWAILTIVLYVTDRSLLMGTMATVPTIVSVVMVWGSMFFLDISMNVMTLSIASLTVGMGVTYGIHICHRFTEERNAGASVDESVCTATSQTGQGVLGAAATTALGFGILGLSVLPPMQQFGLITALAIIFAFLGAIVFLPSLLTLYGRLKERRAGQ